MYDKQFTPTQQRLFQMLLDGKSHTKEELKTCLFDELAKPEALSAHFSAMRKFLRPDGLNILCVFQNRKRVYQLVRLLRND